MRCYRADMLSVSTTTRVFEGFDVLFEKLDRKAVALPHIRQGGGWFDDDADREKAKPNLAVCVIAKDGHATPMAIEKLLERALSIWDVNDAERISIEECTLQECFCINTHRSEFYDRDVRALLGLGPLNEFMRIGRTNWVHERMIDRLSGKEEALRYAKDSSHSLSLSAEIVRMFEDAEGAGRSERGAEPTDLANRALLPIHYVIEGGASTDADDATSILLGSLQGAGRIHTGHAFYFNFDESLGWLDQNRDSYRALMTEQLVSILDGNAVVIRYGEFDGASSFDNEMYQSFMALVNLLNDNENDIQVIFQVPKGKSEVIRRLRANFDEPLVTIGVNCGTQIATLGIEKSLERLCEMALGDGFEDNSSIKLFLSKSLSQRRQIDIESVYADWRNLVKGREEHPAYAEDITTVLEDVACDDESAMAQLEELIGLEGAKKVVRSVIKRVRMNRKLMEKGLPEQDFSMNMVFAGAPGTGKTEVARLYAQILKEAGILREGRLVCRSGAEGFNVKDAFETAKGSVLFIDEAYSLYGYSDRIASLIAHMEDHRSDTVVILAGYKGHMNALLDCNPGFRSRIGFTVDFPDYTADELLQIFDLMCKRGGVSIEEDARKAARDVIERCGKRSDHGNARFVRNLYESIVGAQQERLADIDEVEYSEEVLTTITLADVEEATSRSKDDGKTGRELLDELIGLSGVKAEVSSRLDFAMVRKMKRDAGMDAPYISMHMAFKGAPGTGKTEVARLVGRIMREEGVLSVGDFYELSGSDLVAGMPGTSSSIVESLFAQARGSVVFIDEAYSLLYGGANGAEAIAAIIAQMENLRDEVVVIFAGYSADIDALFAANAGFASRVKTHITFPDYSVSELVEIFRKMATDRDCLLGAGIDGALEGIFEQALKSGTFGNARFARNLLEDALLEQGVRLASKMREGGTKEPTKRQLRTILACDVEAAAQGIPASDATRTIGFAA